ncbi:hypothetical protein [Bilophila wadsworthia]|uniref:hypothetical protein n=1 Tax=Bilophila wadsworthia TaxID=35833 RepID=UPI0026DD3677|nr:hypothetical protein [Bilophila wadsworthia]
MDSFEKHRKEVEQGARKLAHALEDAHRDGYSFSVRFLENPFLDTERKLRLIAVVEPSIPDVTGATTRTD